MTSIVIVTYNGLKWLNTCLASIDFEIYKVIIIDNASTDETTSFIETNYPDVVLIKQTKNLGFGQANNIGIRYALDTGVEHVFLLNQDAYLVGDVLKKLIYFQENNLDYGIVSPVHVTQDKRKLDHGFFKYMLKENSGQFYSDFVLGNTLAKVYDVPFVNAAGWLVSRSCLETVGGFDPLFFHYGEDDNYCQRVHFHDFKIGVVPNCYIIHDRETRTRVKPKLFSSDYYKNIERIYKIAFADINSDNGLDLKVKKLKRLIFGLYIKMKFKRATSFKKELNILLNLKPLINESRNLNVTKGPHYL